MFLRFLLLRGVRAPLACVLGEADLVRTLNLRGIRCALAAPPLEPMRHSRFVSHVLDWVDPWKSPERLVEHLLRFAGEQPDKPVLYYNSDAELLLVSRFRDVLRSRFSFVVPDVALVEELVDKERFYRLAATLNLPTPPSRRLSVEAADDPDDLGLRFPVVVKPLTRRDTEWRPQMHGAKALLARTPNALRALWPSLGGLGPLIAQEFIQGPESQVESYHVYVDRGGDIAGEFAGKKVRTYPASFGDTTALVITDTPDVMSLGRDCVGRLGLRGVAKLDFKRGPDGRLYLLEVNPRFSLWHHAGAVAGVNLPAMVYDDVVGRPRAHTTRLRPGTRWCNVASDRRAARAVGMPFLHWLRWAVTSEAKWVVAWDDPWPFLRGILWRKMRDMFVVQRSAST